MASPKDPSLPLEVPELTVSPDGELFVSWIEEDEGHEADVFVARSRDGETFEGPFAVGELEDPRAEWPRRPVVLATHDHLWTAFSARDGGLSTSIFVYRAPLDDLASFEPVTKFEMPPDYHDMVYPRLAMHPDGDVWIAMIASPEFDGELWVARERHDWAVENVTANNALERPCECCPPDLYFASDGTAWVAWRGDIVRDVFAARAPDPDALFEGFEVVGTQGIEELVCPLDGPILLEVGGALHLGWSDTHPVTPRAWLSTRGTDGSWTTQAVTSSDDLQSRVFLAEGREGRLHLGYETLFYGPYREAVLEPGAEDFSEPVDVVGPEGPLGAVQADTFQGEAVAVGVDEGGSVWFVTLTHDD